MPTASAGLADTELIPLSPGDQAFLKQLSPKSLKSRWMGSHTVVLTTLSAAKLLGHQCWYHLSRLKRPPVQDDWSVQWLGPTTLQFSSTPPLVIIFLGLLGKSNLTSSPAFCWHFYVQETWSDETGVHTSSIGQEDCSSWGCQSLIYIQIPTFKCLEKRCAPEPHLHLTYDQIYGACHTYWIKENGGCPWHYCTSHGLYWCKGDPRDSVALRPLPHYLHLVTSPPLFLLFLS